MLSEKFCQDRLESFFSQQRYKGGRSNIPSAKEFMGNAVSLRVQGSNALAPLRGSTSRKREDKVIHVDDTLMKKRKVARRRKLP